MSELSEYEFPEYMKDRPDLFIGGRWRRSHGGEVVNVTSPATRQIIGSATLATTSDIDDAVGAARSSFDSGVWAGVAPAQRAAVLDRAADFLEARAPDLAVSITSELGCPIWFSQQAHVPSPIHRLRYYAEIAGRYSYDELRTHGDSTSLVTHEPVGVVAAITPWNGPLSSPALKVAPALAAGCSVVLKPPPETPLSAYALADALAESGLPEGVLSVLPGDRDAGAHLAGHPAVDKVTFTGSTAAGRAILAAAAPRIARTSLELGGKSAAIILDDADLDDALSRLLPMAMLVNGQACIAQTRVLVPRDREQEIIDALAELIEQQRIGNPLDPDVTIGPLVSKRQRDRVEGYISLAQDEGATVVSGGRPLELAPPVADGWFVRPTLLGGVSSKMRVAQEEIFGPVVAVIAYDGDDDAVRIANDSIYGLSGSVWSRDTDRAVTVARRIRTGMVSVNGHPQTPHSPFGGYKQSGLGREMGPEGFLGFLETKSIAVPAGF